MKIEINASDELVIKSLRPISDAVFYDKGRINAGFEAAKKRGWRGGRPNASVMKNWL